nr:hypothetical protein Itr_chr02CG19980 [Ipomoea trifida]
MPTTPQSCSFHYWKLIKTQVIVYNEGRNKLHATNAPGEDIDWEQDGQLKHHENQTLQAFKEC